MLAIKALNLNTVLKAVKNVEKQTQFAAAKTLTGAAFAAQKATKEHIKQKLILRNSWLSRNVWVQRATKGQLVSYVGFTDRVSWAKLLEEGGTRKPKQSRNIAIPQGVRSSPNQKVPKRLTPSALKARKDVFRATLNGIDGLWQRVSENRIKLLYNFDPATQYEPQKIQFRKVASEAAIKHIARNMDRNLAEAFRTSK